MRCAGRPRSHAQVPELPEVETIASDLRPLLVGRSIEAVDLRFPTIVRHPEPEVFARGLAGQKVVALDRRGKYMLLRLSGGAGPSGGFAATSPRGGEASPGAAVEAVLVIHLGMTGQLLHKLPEDPERPHTHVVLDARQRHAAPLLRSAPIRPAAARVGRGAGGRPQAARLGPEPLDPAFTPRDLHRRLSGRRAPLKLLLLDQSVLAGVGNIYADEACYRARIRPDRPAGRDLPRTGQAAPFGAARIAPAGDRQPGQLDRRLRRPLRRQGPPAGGAPGLRPGRPALLSAAAVP